MRLSKRSPSYPHTGNFNPRTPVGCDANPYFSAFNINLFQSTHPSGVRHAPGLVLHLAVRISIHAPQWGATVAAFQTWARRTISIHAPQWGATILQRPPPSLHSISIHAPQWGATNAIINPIQPTVFQSTHPSGVRHGGVSGVLGLEEHFNPRTPVGCDLLSFAIPCYRCISIHAPQWGATRTYASCICQNVFQSTHPSGVRLGHQIIPI